MKESKNERNRLLIKVCQLYYEDGLNQQDIANRLGISRPHVSRMLTAAKKEGIVQISIKNPYSLEQRVEKLLIDTFGIRDAVVVDAPYTDEQSFTLQLGRTGALLMESILKDNDVVGIMAGRAISAIGAEVDYFARSNLQFVPLVGGWGSEGGIWHANSNTMILADKLKSKYWLLHAPAIVTNEELGGLLKKEAGVEKVLNMAKCCDVAVVGIGDVSEKATIVQSGNFNPMDLERVRNSGAVANICASFLDSMGKTIDSTMENKMLGLAAQELRGIRNVIGIAGGKDKVEAITAVLRGKWIDILVTDMVTAQSVLDFHTKNIK
ncbi:sugar-binding transcriptional regulator [Pelosinus baikalensis]|uniref:Sugar-binding transcriptional regulator n=1 Tax=Pelosinus baikalensis TaxID=2892015 RepID=A0ABS8HZ34_9FIRM|nr:sugar-binding transcriptional regulator [Pelosinus baikalensis]MCC5468426.1 sugar-binding transcriptional regulator [Pelosinus baikalensis]